MKSFIDDCLNAGGESAYVLQNNVQNALFDVVMLLNQWAICHQIHWLGNLAGGRLTK